MRVDKFTTKTREALVEAQQIASKKGHAEITPEHLLWALLRQEGGITSTLLRRLGSGEGTPGGVDPAALAAQVETYLDRQPKASGAIDVGLSRRARDLIETAEREAEQFKDEYTSTEHLLL